MGPAELNGRQPYYRPITKATAAGIIVLFLGGAGKYVWDLHEKLALLRAEVRKDYVLMGVHRADLDRLNKFMIEGRRFTLERGESLESDFESLADEHDALRLVVDENKLRLARMPHQLIFPFSDEWQRRISECEKATAINAERVKELSRKMNNGN